MIRSSLLLAAVGMLAILPPPAAWCLTESSPYDHSIKRVFRLANSPYVRMLPVGRSHEGRALCGLVISDFSVEPTSKARILICAGQHGDEYNPVRSVLSLCEDLADGKRPDLLARCAFIVVPVVNPDGLHSLRRRNGQGLDINRDWVQLRTSEARFVDRLVRQWKPQVMVDVHEWMEHSTVPGNGIEVPRCVSPSRREALHSMAARAARRSGMAVVSCSATGHVGLFHRRYSSLGYASYLIETAAGEDYDAKNTSYRAAITMMAELVAWNPDKSAAISPAAVEFDLPAVSAYLAPEPADQGVLSSGFRFAALLAAAYALIVWVMKPLTSPACGTRSRRFRRYDPAKETGMDACTPRRALPPITARSLNNRRMRSRCASAARGNI